MSESSPLTIGVHDEYQWLVCEHCLDDLLRLCPQIVLGKFVAVTSVDSGHYFPTEEELGAGWERRNGIAYSPRVKNVEILPREGWDEWYVFEERFDLGGMAAPESNPFEASLVPGEVYAFVNYSSVGLHLPHKRGIAPYFWKQFDWIRPRSYIAESGDYLFVISKDKELFEAAREVLAALDSSLSDDAQDDGGRSR
jgi:hypothetical protein